MRTSGKRYGRQSRCELEGAGGVRVLVSYATPVAAFVSGAGYLVTNRKYSVTTSRHVRAWLAENGWPKAAPASPERLRELYDWCCGRSSDAMLYKRIAEGKTDWTVPALPQPEY